MRHNDDIEYIEYFDNNKPQIPTKSYITHFTPFWRGVSG